MKQTRQKLSAYTVNLAIERNDINELKQLHNITGIGRISQCNYEWHISCTLKATKFNIGGWRLRTKLLDSILTHPLFRTIENIADVTLQLEEVN